MLIEIKGMKCTLQYPDDVEDVPARTPHKSSGLTYRKALSRINKMGI